MRNKCEKFYWSSEAKIGTKIRGFISELVVVAIIRCIQKLMINRLNGNSFTRSQYKKQLKG
jgi:hypothetical protein